ncbi:MAG TPA: aminotransferase class V-fold PLP-dependent enzyme [Candidatus Methanofastidiosa archaeon]|nr:aminotransferase class V-fold PLP-dependent enzyme [Candidatus Methanofastidiosa archaeon]
MDIRDQFDITENYTYLNTAATSPLPRYVVSEVESFLDSHARYAEGAWDLWVEKVNLARARCAALIGCRPEEVSFLKNTGEGLNTICSMLPGKGNVVTTNMEFPSNFLPWRRKYADLRVVDLGAGEVSPDDFERLIDDDTEAVSFSEITYRTGARLPTREISEIAHEHGAIVVSDAVQALGAVRVDVGELGIDVLCCGSHKWLMSPFGVGMFHISLELMDRYDPPFIGWFSLEDDEDFSLGNTRLASSARRFEIGNLNYPGIMGLSRSVEVMMGRGTDVIDDEVTILSEYLMERLQDNGYGVVTPNGAHGGIVSFRAKDPDTLVKRLLKERIVVSCRGDVRVSTHFWNNKDDIDTLIDALGGA